MNENVNKAEDMSMVQACNTGVKAAVPYGAGDEQGEAAAVSAADILNSLFAPEDTVCLRVFSDKKCSAFHGQKLECKCRDYLKDMEPRLREHNEVGRGVFFVVNSGGQTDDAITRINAQFVEMDDGTFEEQWEKINSFPLPPSMVIRTRKSLHAYWFMEKGKAEVESFRDTQKGLVRWFEGDPACVNLSRVMRLPGFYHNKTDTPVMVRCVSFHPERRYTQEQLLAVLHISEENKPAQAVHKSSVAKGIEAVIRGCQFIQHCRDNAADLPEPLWHALATILAPLEGGRELFHELSRPYQGYTYEETEQKINKFLESETGPMTCEKICERGFKCSKFDQGGCGVKSPAALCFKPLDTDALLEILRGLPVSGDILKDIKTAKSFVLDYLHNQDPVVAEVVISEKVREHFRLKTGMLKSLLAEYRNARKTFPREKCSQSGSDLPEWYEATNAGIRFLPGILAKELAASQNVFYAAGQYYRYQNGVYRDMEKIEAQRIVQSKMLPSETKMLHITDAEEQWRLMIRKSLDDINPDPYVINLQNGLYSVTDDKLSPHDPEYPSTIQLPVNYVENAECSRFVKFLKEAMCDDEEQIELVQEIMGYCIAPITSAQKSFIFMGAAAAGKSVLLSVIGDILLGRRNVSHISWQALNERFKSAELFGKLANIFADLPTKNIDDNGIFKGLVGEDYITVEKKHKDPFNFKSTARLLFSCNKIPKNYGDKSEGFYRRLIIITFNRSVPEEDRNPYLLDELRAEADGIFMFALAGLKRLMKNNYQFSVAQTNIDALQRYREESDSVRSFVKDCCELKPDKAIGSTELYNAYYAYCEEFGMKAYAQKTFVQQLTVAFPDITRAKDSIGKRRVLNGIVRADEFSNDDD